jgi:hypothetical protein
MVRPRLIELDLEPIVFVLVAGLRDFPDDLDRLLRQVNVATASEASE